MSEFHLLVQRWFTDGEGWAYDSSLPQDLRLEAHKQIELVASRFKGETIQQAEPVTIGNYDLWILILRDEHCLDPKAATRLPHIDIGVLVPKDTPVNSKVLLRYFQYAEEEIHHRGVFAPVRFSAANHDGEKGKRLPWAFIILGLAVSAGVMISGHASRTGRENASVIQEAPELPEVLPEVTTKLPETRAETRPEAPAASPEIPPAVLPEPEKRILVSTSGETKILRDWNLRFLAGTNDHNRLRRFIEFIRKPAELLSDPSITGSQHPEVGFLRTFPQKTFPDLQEEVPEDEYQRLIGQLCAAFGVSRFEEIQARLPDFREYCEGLAEVELDQPTSDGVRLFIERYAGELITCDSLEETKRLKEWRLPILAGVINDKERLNAFIERVINQPRELMKGFEPSQNPEVQFLAKFPQQAVTPIQGKATRWEFEAKIREICRAFGVKKFHEIPEALPNFQKVCEDLPVETLREPTSEPIHAFVLSWLEEVPDSQQGPARLLSPEKREECRKIPWLVTAEYFENLQPGSVSFRDAPSLASDERNLAEKLKEIGLEKNWKFTGRTVREIQEEFAAIQTVYDRIQKNGGRK